MADETRILLTYEAERPTDDNSNITEEIDIDPAQLVGDFISEFAQRINKQPNELELRTLNYNTSLTETMTFEENQIFGNKEQLILMTKNIPA